MGEKCADDLVYVAPPSSRAKEARRVYVLPRSLVQRIHEYGYENGHPTEVSAVREPLDAALSRHGEGK